MPECSMGNRFSVAIVHSLSPNILAWSGGTRASTREASVCPKATRSTLTAKGLPATGNRGEWRTASLFLDPLAGQRLPSAVPC